MPVPPQPGGEEAEVEELPGLDVQFMQAAPAQVDVDDLRAGRLHRAHEQSVFQVVERRCQHAEGEHAERGDGDEAHPIPACGSGCEHAAHTELVWNRDREGCVADQVKDEPGLVRQSPPDDHPGGEADQAEQAQRGHGQHEVVERPQAGEFCEDADLLAGGVGDQQGHGMDEQQADRGHGERSMLQQRPVVADGAVDERDTRGQQQHLEQHRHGDQPGNDANRLDEAGKGRRHGQPILGDEDGHRNDQEQGQDDVNEVGPESPE